MFILSCSQTSSNLTEHIKKCFFLKKNYQRLVSKNRSTKLKNDGRSQVDYNFFEHTIIKSFKTPSVVGGVNSFSRK